MKALSSPWWLFYITLLVAGFVFETIFSIINSEYLPWGLVPNVMIAGILAWHRNVKIIRYDDSSLFVKGWRGSEIISMSKIAAVNIPSSWRDLIYEIELKSGRKIEFIPTFSRPVFMWNSPEAPENVILFQKRVATYESRQRV